MFLKGLNLFYRFKAQSEVLITVEYYVSQWIKFVLSILALSGVQNRKIFCFSRRLKNEYDQDIPQSHTADQTTT